MVCLLEKFPVLVWNLSYIPIGFDFAFCVPTVSVS